MTTTPTDGLEALREKVLEQVDSIYYGSTSEPALAAVTAIMEAIEEHYQPIIEKGRCWIGPFPHRERHSCIRWRPVR